jgi:hypothetical protein
MNDSGLRNSSVILHYTTSQYNAEGMFSVMLLALQLGSEVFTPTHGLSMVKHKHCVDLLSYPQISLTFPIPAPYTPLMIHLSHMDVEVR